MRILVVEDNTLIGKALKKGLTEEGYAVDWATNVVDGVHLVNEFEYDALILDLMLPDGDGLAILTNLRKTRHNTAVLVLTAKDTLQDKVLGFKLGADDYLAKPFEFEELLARVQALIRRKYQIFHQTLEVGRLKLNLAARTVAYSEALIHLTAKEFAVLELFLVHRGHVLSREKISEHIHNEDTDLGSNVIDVFINKLRRKLESANVPDLIETVRGEGYVVR